MDTLILEMNDIISDVADDIDNRVKGHNEYRPIYHKIAKLFNKLLQNREIEETCLEERWWKHRQFTTLIFQMFTISSDNMIEYTWCEDLYLLCKMASTIIIGSSD